MACLPRIAFCLCLPLICFSGCKPFQQGSLSRMQTPLPAADQMARRRPATFSAQNSKTSQVQLSDTSPAGWRSNSTTSDSLLAESHSVDGNGNCEQCGVNHSPGGVPTPFRFSQPLPQFQPVANPSVPAIRGASASSPEPAEETYSSAIRVRPLQPEEALSGQAKSEAKPSRPAPPPEPDDTPTPANLMATATATPQSATDPGQLAPLTQTSGNLPSRQPSDPQFSSTSKDGQSTPSLTATTSVSPANAPEALTKLAPTPLAEAAPASPVPPSEESNELSSALEDLKSLIANSSKLDTAAEFTAELTALELLIERVHNLSASAAEPTAEQTLCEHQLQALVATLRPDALDISRPEGRQIAGRTLDHLREAITQLEKLVSLKVTHGALCTEVRGFGQYKPFSSQEFRVGQPVLLYCEIENFCSVEEPTQGNALDYRTRLKSSLVICREDGSVAQQAEFPVVEDVARNRRRDFYLYVPFTVGELAPGKYRAHLMVDDLQGRKQAVLDPPVEFSVK